MRRVSKLQVAYRETINQLAEAQGKYIHKTDDEGHLWRYYTPVGTVTERDRI